MTPERPQYLAVTWTDGGNRTCEPFDPLDVQELVEAIQAREAWADVCGHTPIAQRCRRILWRLRSLLT